MLTFVVNLDSQRRSHHTPQSSSKFKSPGSFTPKQRVATDATAMDPSTLMTKAQHSTAGKAKLREHFHFSNSIDITSPTSVYKPDSPTNSLQHCLDVIRKGNEAYRRQPTTSVQNPPPQPLDFTDHMHKHLML